MEQEYVIGVTNRYALFLDESSHEEDPLEIIKNAEAEKSKKKTLKTISGESKENKVKPELKAKPVVAAARKGQGIKETQNVKPADPPAPVSKLKHQDGSVKLSIPPGRKLGEKISDRPSTGDRSVKFAPGENRRPRDDKQQGEFQQRNGYVRNRNVRDGEPRGGKPSGGGDSRPFRQAGDSENRPPRRERREFQDRGDAGREATENGEGRPDRRTGGPVGRTRGSRSGNGPANRNFDGRGKREFERKSGSDKTGVKAVDKREGGGAHNWGTHKDDLDTVSNNLNSTTLSDDNGDWSDVKPAEAEPPAPEPKETDGTGTGTDGEPVPPAEEEPKELTLDEYRAMRGKREMPQYNLRKAGEGEDLTQWKNMYEIKKKKDAEEQDDDDEYDAAEYPQRVGRQRHVLDIDITFTDSRRGARGGRVGGGAGRAQRPPGLNTNAAGAGGGGGGGGGGQGGVGGAGSGGRGGRQRDGPRIEGGQRRGPRDDFGVARDRGGRQSAPKVDDEHDFPSLG